ncbi:thiolase domain-containing protein [Candidatus Dependentiae bacterium]|nr:thiolase domain-containing protein [Candidatus Dependentiae bacterium]
MKIAVIGSYCTKFGELWNKSLYDLLAESQIGSLKNANILSNQIDAIYTGNMCSGILSGQLHLSSMATEILNVNCPSISVENACASGGVALRQAILAIESGTAEIVMVNGVEKLTDLDSTDITSALISAGNEEFEHFIGATFPSLNALITRAYMHEYKLTRKQLAHVSIKNHKNAINNPLAHLKKEITIKDFSNATIIADPLTILDCPPISDGAVTLILSSEKFAKNWIKKNTSKKIVYITASTQSSDTLTLSSRNMLTEFKATQIAAQKAYDMAKIKLEQIDVVELHDGFSITEIISLEDLGFFKKGTAGIATEKGLTQLNKKISVNPSGGLKAKGHPVGATGISQAYEIIKQLQHKAGQNQVKNAKIGLTHNLGGCAGTSVIHIFTGE